MTIMTHKISRPSTKVMEELNGLGICKIEDINENEIRVSMSEGWKTQATDHCMYSNIVDNKDQVRATYAHKTAYWDEYYNIYTQKKYRNGNISLYFYDVTLSNDPIPSITDSNNNIIWLGKPIKGKNGWIPRKDCPYAPDYCDIDHNADRVFYSPATHADMISRKMLQDHAPDNLTLTAYFDKPAKFPKSETKFPAGKKHIVKIQTFVKKTIEIAKDDKMSRSLFEDFFDNRVIYSQRGDDYEATSLESEEPRLFTIIAANKKQAISKSKKILKIFKHFSSSEKTLVVIKNNDNNVTYEYEI